MEYPKISASYRLDAEGWQQAELEPKPIDLSDYSRSQLAKVASDHFVLAGRLASDLGNDFFGHSERHAPRSRIRYICALASLSEHLGRLGLSPALSVELLELAHALSDLDAGTVHPVLRASPPNGAPPARGDVWRTRAYIASAVSLLMEDGTRKGAACELVAKRHPHFGWPPTAKVGPLPADKLAAAIAEWHKVFAGGDATDEIAQSSFDDRYAFFRSLAETHALIERRDIALRVLDHAEALAARSNDADSLAIARELLKRKRPARG
ncbi:hypothetical protein [Bosea sp. PAMC 26642]|uniref:hypothetical protein n=1 Tax=Bosea sp. (strain PAMC 26642) TaxID=1792307 RepID=UPI000A640B6C|nr:hypothetical protein [Bosea sp. PAMC 26642]